MAQAGTDAPFAVDLEDLHALASEVIVRRGIAYFKENRVVELGWDEHRLWASVEGSTPGTPYAVEVTRDDDELCFECDCPFDWEPVCKHAVAALLAFGARQPVSDQTLESAADAAVADRLRRARGEVAVEHVAGGRAFGTWRAWSVGAVGPAVRRYRVDLRSLTTRINYCTCPDFATNRLGTCKHIEAVIHRLAKRRRRPPEPKVAVVYLAWDVPDPPRISVRAPARLTPELGDALRAFFDAEGGFRGALPDDFHRLEAIARERTDLVVSEDASRFARRAAEAAAHRERAVRIREDITSRGGRLPGVDARLYPYQVEGVAFLAANGRALLADDMGLGKTLQSIAAATYLMRHEGP